MRYMNTRMASNNETDACSITRVAAANPNTIATMQQTQNLREDNIFGVAKRSGPPFLFKQEESVNISAPDFFLLRPLYT
jgi:hypothetical protein